jgi:hypothetical protein
MKDAETYGYPGPEGPLFWAFLMLALGIVFLGTVTQPLWTNG